MVEGQGDHVHTGMCTRAGLGQGQMLLIDFHLVAGQDDGPFDDIPQFADIPWPVIAHERLLAGSRAPRGNPADPCGGPVAQRATAAFQRGVERSPSRASTGAFDDGRGQRARGVVGTALATLIHVGSAFMADPDQR